MMDRKNGRDNETHQKLALTLSDQEMTRTVNERTTDRANERERKDPQQQTVNRNPYAPPMNQELLLVGQIWENKLHACHKRQVGRPQQVSCTGFVRFLALGRKRLRKRSEPKGRVVKST